MAPPIKRPFDRGRSSLLRRALLLPDRPTFGTFRLRPFSLWTLDLCEEIGLDFFLKLPDGVPPAGNRSFQLATLVWAHDEAVPCDRIDMALALGTWRDEVKTYARRGDLADALDDLMRYIAFFRELIHASSVRVRHKPRGKGDREDKEPANLLEPGNTYALIWSITGGAIQGPAHLRALYRETPIPVILSFYHCALRAALVWTVPPKSGAGKPDRAKLERAAAVRAQVLAPPTETLDYF